MIATKDNYQWTSYKGYDVEIDNRGDHWIGDIKFPCGELVHGFECQRFDITLKKVLGMITRLPIAYHQNCEIDYCLEGR